MWGKVGKKWEKVGISGERWGKVGKSWKKGIFLTKWPAAAILDDRKSLSIAFLAISDQYAAFFFLLFFFKMAASSYFGSQFLPKSIGTYLYSRSVSRSNIKLIGAFLMKLWSAQAFSSMAVSNMNLIRALVSQLWETQALACGGGGGGGGGGCGGGVQTKTIISPKFQISGI